MTEEYMIEQDEVTSLNDDDIFLVTTDPTDPEGTPESNIISWKSIKTLIASVFGTIINSLSSKSNPVGTDVISIGDSEDSYSSKKVVLSNLYKSLGTGTQDDTTFLRGDGTYAIPDGGSWVDIDETLTYASANTFTVSGDKTTFYTRGLKLKLPQTTDKYFYVYSSSYSSPNTTVKITAGDNYTLANATITNPQYSNDETPNNFPPLFSWTPTFSGFSSAPSTVLCQFRILPYGMYCEILATGGTSNATTFTLSVPPGVTLPASSTLGFVLITIDNGAVITTSPGKLLSDSLGTSYSLQKDFAGTAWTNSGSKGARFVGIHLLP